ncbi:MAG: hypothetical protein ABSF26_21020, partial [Thermoguttaceae bacterium]
MWTKSLFGHRVRGVKRPSHSVTSRKDNRRRRLAFEPLEDRRLLSNLLVTSNADDGSAGTLRAKIDQANSDGKSNIADAIYFSTSLAGDQITLSQGALPLNAGAAVTIWDTDQSGNTVPITIKGAGTNLLQVASGA